MIAPSVSLSKNSNAVKNKKKKLWLFVAAVLAVSAVCFSACKEREGETPAVEQKGPFYSLEYAYNKGFLTTDDLQTIADYHNNGISPSRRLKSGRGIFIPMRSYCLKKSSARPMMKSLRYKIYRKSSPLVFIQAAIFLISTFLHKLTEIEVGFQNGKQEFDLQISQIFGKDNPFAQLLRAAFSLFQSAVPKGKEFVLIPLP